MIIYSATSKEIFIDSDRGPINLGNARQVLRMCGINQAKIFEFPSSGDGLHYVIRIDERRLGIERASMAALMGSDRNRAILTIARIRNNIKNPDVLFAQKAFPWRRPDLICECKHPSDKIRGCPHLHKFRENEILRIAPNNLIEMEKRFPFFPMER